MAGTGTGTGMPLNGCHGTGQTWHPKKKKKPNT